MIVNRCKKTLGLAVLILASVASVSAQDNTNTTAITLKDALSAAAEYDQRIKAAQSSVNAMKETRREAASGYKPKLNAIGGISYSKIDKLNSLGSTQQDGKRLSGGVELTQNIYTFGRTGAQMGKAASNIAVAEAELTLTQLTVFEETAAAYIEFTRTNEAVAVYRSHTQTLSSLVRSTEAQFKQDLVTATELALVRSRYRQAEAQLATAKAEQTSHRQKLERLTRLDTRLTLSPASTTLNSLPKLTVDNAIQYGIALSPELSKKMAEEQRSKFSLKYAKSELYPSLIARGAYTKGHVGQLTTGEKEIGLNMSVPLYDGGAKRSRVRRARHEYEQSKYLLRDTEEITRQLVQSAWSELEAAKVAAVSWQSALAYEKESLKGIEAEVEEELRSLIYLLEAKDDMIMVQIQTARAEASLAHANIRLLRVTGQLIDLAR